ncbi:MAG: HD domain-containing protein [Candidatus Margulisbacteria bacterium]|nr:HD domain-containing protein [Candidatus Margulisiibacteriota bacterium]
MYKKIIAITENSELFTELAHLPTSGYSLRYILQETCKVLAKLFGAMVMTVHLTNDEYSDALCIQEKLTSDYKYLDVYVQDASLALRIAGKAFKIMPIPLKLEDNTPNKGVAIFAALHNGQNIPIVENDQVIVVPNYKTGKIEQKDLKAAGIKNPIPASNQLISGVMAVPHVKTTKETIGEITFKKGVLSIKYNGEKTSNIRGQIITRSILKLKDISETIQKELAYYLKLRNSADALLEEVLSGKKKRFHIFLAKLVKSVFLRSFSLLVLYLGKKRKFFTYEYTIKDYKNNLIPLEGTLEKVNKNKYHITNTYIPPNYGKTFMYSFKDQKFKQIFGLDHDANVIRITNAEGYVILPLAPGIVFSIRNPAIENNFNGINKELSNKILNAYNILKSYSPLLKTYKYFYLIQSEENKDPYTRGHSDNVRKHSLGIIDINPFIKGEVGDVNLSALLHDIGKIKIPDHILTKPDRLTREEYEIMKQHVIETKNILEENNFPQDVIDAAYQHHERYDGRGYPNGLKKEQIHPHARIINVADIYDAIKSQRVYKSSRTIGQTVHELTSNTFTQSFPETVESDLKYLLASHELKQEVPIRSDRSKLKRKICICLDALQLATQKFSINNQKISLETLQNKYIDHNNFYNPNVMIICMQLIIHVLETKGDSNKTLHELLTEFSKLLNNLSEKNVKKFINMFSQDSHPESRF